MSYVPGQRSRHIVTGVQRHHNDALVRMVLLASKEETDVQASMSRSAATLCVPSVSKCGGILFALKAVLRIGGFAVAIKWLRCRLQHVPPTPSFNEEVLTATEGAVARSAAFFPGRVACLEQSLLLYYLLRRQGIPVRYCHGVQPHPFLAHAWIEYNGEPLNDVPEHVKHFARLPDILP